MKQQIYVNLAVKDLQRSMAFFTVLGYRFNPEFTNDKAACMVISDEIYAMLLTEPFFAGFTHKQLCDAHTSTEVMLCLSCNSREEVDRKVALAYDAGGRVHGEPKDHGFMYYHAFEDLDGHIWELMHMVTAADDAAAANTDTDSATAAAIH